MFFTNVVSMVRSVVDWLDAGTDAYSWETAEDLISEAMEQAERMAQPIRRRDKGFENQPPQLSPVAHEVRNTWPHLRSLRAALQLHDGEAASHHGRKALVALEGQPEGV